MDLPKVTKLKSCQIMTICHLKIHVTSHDALLFLIDVISFDENSRHLNYVHAACRTWHTSSWGAPSSGFGSTLNHFLPSSLLSFRCIDPTTCVRGSVIVDLRVHARVESKVGLYMVVSQNWGTPNHPF